MSSVVSGDGLKATEISTYFEGAEIRATRVSVDQIDPTRHIQTYDAPGKGYVLMTNDYGGLEWTKPFDSDKELRDNYPALEEAWGTLMEALEEYQVVKKLVMDHKKDEL